jgi:hypothetical protein
MVQSGKIDPKRLITHCFKLGQILDAYDPFGRAAQTRALKESRPESAKYAHTTIAIYDCGQTQGLRPRCAALKFSIRWR